MIYTTKYSVASKLPRNKYFVVRTSLGGCRFCKADHNFSAIAPTRQMLNLPVGDDGNVGSDYIEAYTQHLENGIEAIRAEIKNLESVAGNRDIVLCCFCDVVGGAVCHRRIFAKWYHGKTGTTIPELPVVPQLPRVSLRVKPASARR